MTIKAMAIRRPRPEPVFKTGWQILYRITRLEPRTLDQTRICQRITDLASIQDYDYGHGFTVHGWSWDPEGTTLTLKGSIKHWSSKSPVQMQIEIIGDSEEIKDFRVSGQRGMLTDDLAEEWEVTIDPEGFTRYRFFSGYDIPWDFLNPTATGIH